MEQIVFSFLRLHSGVCSYIPFRVSLRIHSRQRLAGSSIFKYQLIGYSETVLQDQAPNIAHCLRDNPVTLVQLNELEGRYFFHFPQRDPPISRTLACVQNSVLVCLSITIVTAHGAIFLLADLCECHDFESGLHTALKQGFPNIKYAVCN